MPIPTAATVNTPSSNRLNGRVSLISGGAQGIGFAIATLFQLEGSCVFLLDCDAQNGKSAAAELTARNPSLPVRYIRADLQDPGEIQNAVSGLRKHHDRVDVLVNNAGIEMEKPLAKLTVADWDLVLNVNLRGAFLLAQAAVPLFPASGGAIVNISSIHATHAFPDSVPYACSKAGLVALTRNLALELAPRHIRVNCICPGYIDTRRNSPLRPPHCIHWAAGEYPRISARPRCFWLRKLPLSLLEPIWWWMAASPSGLTPNKQIFGRKIG